MKIDKRQRDAIGTNAYAARMRQFLNSQFPETKEIDGDELHNIILELTERAAAYKLIFETHVAPFIVASWIMGVGFDQNFITAKTILENLDMDSQEKADWIWQFLDGSIGALEGRSPAGDVTPFG